MDIINIVSLIIGVISLILGIHYGNQSRRTYHLLMSNFDQKVIDILLNLSEKRQLANAQQVRGLIRNIAVEYGISMPSDEYIVRVLRRMALRYEQDSKDHQKELMNLESIREKIEPYGPPLMSIASINRLAAFQIIMGSAIIMLIVYQFLYLSSSNKVNWVQHIVVSVLQVLIVIAIYSVRNHLKKLLNKEQQQ